MIDKDRLIQNQIKNFIMDSVKKEINIFYDNLNKFLELYESKNYTEAKVCLDEMRFSTLNLFKAMDLFNPELFSSCIFISYDDPEQYLYDWVVYNPNCKHFALSESDFRFIIHQEVEKLSKEVKENGVLLRDALEKIAIKYLDK